MGSGKSMSDKIVNGVSRLQSDDIECITSHCTLFWLGSLQPREFHFHFIATLSLPGVKGVEEDRLPIPKARRHPVNQSQQYMRRTMPPY